MPTSIRTKGSTPLCHIGWSWRLPMYASPSDKSGKIRKLQDEQQVHLVTRASIVISFPSRLYGILAKTNLCFESTKQDTSGELGIRHHWLWPPRRRSVHISQEQCCSSK
ncbi:hypothetical protein F442_19517 [Phytophthora nicotianae P10297]|uniref:Uncharacterized protein n=3 Tax=Phytophthora nicotianae TaxID=4792 RepID=W2PIY3_PHYN3|nr:hypothetical protein PPTG_24156 [Phytophthora nicotianae INRA-310]ETN00968.1 hypothetical protein PPTG_24156 [Phytophthora nicotianae INRA-310]ETO62382.1 hypothetical protein F444_19701 [Phytophthora nicotianae P1976]ETP31635.1 hypothetical protein F442_19517 [Phytophthora nicotianae P10297]